MTLIFKLCARLRHPFRRLIRCDMYLSDTFRRTRFYKCRVCGKVIREDKKQ